MKTRQEIRYIVGPPPNASLSATGTRAVVYARVSGDDSGKEGRNLAGQLQMGKDYCAKHSYNVIAELAEDVKGASGAEIDLPQLNRVRDLANKRAFDILVVREIDRLSRDLGKQLIIEKELKRRNVRIEYVLYQYPETPEGDLMKHMRGVLSQYERDKTTERTIRGRRLKVQGGSVLCFGRAPYGYRLERQENKYKLVIYEPEAAIVRVIFQWWVHGRVSLAILRKRLMEMGAPCYQKPMRGKPDKDWGTSRLRRMLANETYAGLWHFGKRTRGGKDLPREQWVAVQVPAIIGRRDFDIAQKLLEKNVKRHQTKHEHLMAQRVKCGICDRLMASRPSVQTYKGKTWVNRYYRCDNLRGNLRETHTHGHNASGDRVDKAIWQWLKKILLDPEQLRLGIEAFNARENNAIARLREDLQTAKALLAQKRKEYEDILDLYLHSKLRREVLSSRSQTLDQEITSLETSERELSARLEGATLSEDRIAQIEEFAAQIAEHLDYADDDFAKRRWLIETLNVTGTWLMEDGKQVLDVQCVIGDEHLVISGIANSHNTQNDLNSFLIVPLILTARLNVDRDATIL